MTATHRRHDLSNQVWERLQPHLPGEAGKVGRPAQDNRHFLNAVFWILRTGAPWRDLPPDYGDWKNTHRRFCRWRDRGVWAHLLDGVIDDPDFEWLMIDASYIKVHPHAAGARGGNQAMDRTKGGLNSKLHLAVDAHGMPVRLALTEGTTADCTQAQSLTADLPAQYLLADRGYDTNAIVAEAIAQGMEPVIPPRSHRREPRYYDQDLYRLRHLVENAFLNFKQWRAVATRYAKRPSSFLAICQIPALVLWTKLF